MLLLTVGNERFMFAPDIQGPMVKSTLKQILSNNPHIIILGGPPFYLSDSKVDFSMIKSGLDNLEKIVEQIPITILEHHALRDKNWKKKSKKLFKIASRNGNRISTAAEFLSINNKLFEANRKDLYHKNPPSKKFIQWIQKVKNEKTTIKPPLN
jgi:predicted metallo-beta-lactamase superfamily hydrolase